MRRFLTLALAAAVFATATASGAGEEDRTPAALPLESEGQLRFFVDISSFRGDASPTDVEIFTSITNDQLEYRAEDKDDSESPRSGRIRMEITIRDESGDKAFASKNTLDPAAANELDATDRAIVQVLRETTQLEPGLYHLQVSLTDEFGLRTGLLNRIRRSYRSGAVEGWFQVGDMTSEALAVSDLTMIRGWEVSGDESVFGRHGVDFDPNPQRHYGLVLPRARYYLEVYPGQEYQEGDTYLLQAQVIDKAGIPRLERTTRAKPHEDRFVVADELSLERGVPAGTYQLAVTVLSERTRESVRVIQPFEVIWSVASWGKDPDELLQEMALIMSEKDYR
ncbi:MAG: hypothetical protein HKN12_08460, partial [Gemmatimonadetes bacterium]|nr:hypothetical protein [Gemmatimonadota bacterium]